jgi:hypothetical protein
MPGKEIFICGKDHRPGDLSDTTIELPVDEIPDSPETQPNGGSHNKKVSNLPERLFIFPGKKDPDEEDADQPSMKGHAPMPDGKDLEGIGEVHLEIIKKNIS